MYSIAILSIYAIFYPSVFSNPTGKVAIFFRKILPLILLGIAGFVIAQQWKYDYVPFITKLNPLTAISLMQAYAALWLTHVTTSITWIFSTENSSPWVIPTKIGRGTKLGGLILNGFLCVGLVPLLAIHMVIAALVVWAFFKYGAKRGRRERSASIRS